MKRLRRMLLLLHNRYLKFKIMSITSTDIANLRVKTGAGMMDCKSALEEAGGVQEKAIEILRKKGVLKAAKRADKIAAEGLVYSYIHAGGKIGVLVEVNCETDFVAKTDSFKALCNDIAMHIAASDPECLSNLLEQPFIKDETVTIEKMLQAKTGEIGEKITVRRFARFALGEGIEKKNKDFAEEVEEQLK